MLDNNATEILRIMKITNGNINKPAKINHIKNDLHKEDKGKKEFKEKFNKALEEKNKCTVDSKKVSVNDELIIDNSLKDKIEEQSRISNLVKEMFVKNPDLKDKIDFNSEDNIKDILESLNINDDIDEYEELLGEIEVKASGNNKTNDNYHVKDVNKSNKDKLIEQLKKAIADKNML